ncbi:hypothetical protein DPSP01_014493 [Paraphaeosphaeria sporulosa]
MHWSTMLEEAAEKFNGGPRSFPAASDAEFARGYARRLERSRAKNRIGLGLVEPGDGAAAKEKAAYTTITQQDASTVAWIIKQPTSNKMDFYTSTKTPYLTTGTLLEKVRVLGNPSSLRHAAQFLQAWRQRGLAFWTAGELAGS